VVAGCAGCGAQTELLKEADAAMAHVRRGADLADRGTLAGLKAQEAEDLQINLLFPVHGATG